MNNLKIVLSCIEKNFKIVIWNDNEKEYIDTCFNFKRYSTAKKFIQFVNERVELNNNYWDDLLLIDEMYNLFKLNRKGNKNDKKITRIKKVNK